jgi:hypothetical protein
MVETLKLETLGGVRDRALLLVGFAGAFRRSELVSMNVADASFTSEGLVVQLQRFKTDTKPSTARSARRSAPTRSLARCARCAIGWSAVASCADRSFGRSRRSDVLERSTMAQTGQKSLRVARRDIRDGSLFRRNAAAS